MTKTDLAAPVAAKKKNYTPADIFKICLGLAIVAGFGFLPAPAPMTPLGMKVVGMFLGIVVLWSTVDLIWPSLLGILVASFYAKDIFPTLFYENGAAINGAISYSIGNFVVTFMIASLLLAAALQESGFTRRVTMWFLTRKLAKSSPWAFTAFFWLAALFVGCFIDAMPAAIFFVTLAHELIQELGYKKGDKYPMILLIGTVFAVNIAFGMTPISHPLIIILLTMFNNFTGVAIGMLQFMMVAVPIGLVAFALMFLFFRYVIKPDTSNFEGLDYDAVVGQRPGKMGRKEAIVVVVFAIVVFVWILPGILQLIDPTIPLIATLNSLTITFPAILAVVILLVTRVGGEPILDFSRGMAKVPWGAVLLVASVMVVGRGLTEEVTGVSAFVGSLFAPLVANLPAYFFVVILIAVLIALTGFTSNIPIGILLMAVSLPLAAKIGVNPAIIGVLVAAGAQYSFCIPPGFATLGLLYGDDMVKSSRVLVYGLAVSILSILSFAVVGVPMANLVF
jgi:sodium-dependent dicarboxylate transporter 2/3/5